MSIPEPHHRRVNLPHSPRTLLFVPGDRPDRFDKAAAAGADLVIVDLEDAVPAAHKKQAREAVQAWRPTGPTLVRINPAGTVAAAADLDMLSAMPGLSGVVLPKAELGTDIDRIASTLGDDVAVVALIESAAGLLAAADIAAHPSVVLLAFGNLDFAADCGMTVEPGLELELLPARAHLVHVSRAAGLPGPIDGVTPGIGDEAAIALDAARAVRLGYTGKLCIHPRQIPLIRTAFAPSSEQINWATGILAAVTDGVGTVDGAMVDRPVILKARQILDRAGS